MGYTHYFKLNKNTDLNDIFVKEKYKMAQELFKECQKYFPNVKLCSWNGEGEPLFTEFGMFFNGDKSNNLHYESFCLGFDENNEDYTNGFCKTAREPYDIAVCCALLSFKEVFGEDFEYGGGNCMTDYDELSKKEKKSFVFENEWVEALQVFKKALNDYFIEDYKSVVFHKKLKYLPKKKVI